MKWDFRSVFNIPVNVEIYDDISVLGQSKRMKVGSGYFLLRNVNCALIDGAMVNLLSAKDRNITMDVNIDWINSDYSLEKSVTNILSHEGTYYKQKGVGYDYNSYGSFTYYIKKHSPFVWHKHIIKESMI